MASDYVILYTQCIVERRGISQISGFRSGQRRLRYRMKKILKRTGKIFCLFLLIVVLVNILSPLFCRKPDETYVESLRKTEFTSETAGVERICCIDDNEEMCIRDRRQTILQSDAESWSYLYRNLPEQRLYRPLR